MLKITIISGGQTGVDRAALDVALALGLPCGGWSSNRRRLENGAIPAKYPLREMPSPKYPPRTAKNVREADAALTVKLAGKIRKPFLMVDLDQGGDPLAVRNWIRSNEIETLNVVGPRKSKAPGIHDQVSNFLKMILSSHASAQLVRECRLSYGAAYRLVLKRSARWYSRSA